MNEVLRSPLKRFNPTPEQIKASQEWNKIWAEKWAQANVYLKATGEKLQQRLDTERLTAKQALEWARAAEEQSAKLNAELRELEEAAQQELEQEAA